MNLQDGNIDLKRNKDCAKNWNKINNIISDWVPAYCLLADKMEFREFAFYTQCTNVRYFPINIWSETSSSTTSTL